MIHKEFLAMSEKDKTVDIPTSESDFQKIIDVLAEEVPNTLTNTIPSTPSKDEITQKIERHNNKMAMIPGDARSAAVWSFIEHEKQRADRQKPLLYIIAVFTGFQLLVFNIIISVIAGLAFHNGTLDVISLFFDIFKYYIGATVAELIGMLYFITKGTFSSDHVKIMELLFGDKKSDNQTECQET